MKYDHIVKYNGVYYSAGQEVPDDKIQTNTPEPVEKASEVVDEDKTRTRRGRPRNRG